MTGILQLAASSPPLAPFIVVLFLGFAVGAFGHLIKSNGLIILGIFMILASTAPLMIYGSQT